MSRQKRGGHDTEAAQAHSSEPAEASVAPQGANAAQAAAPSAAGACPGYQLGHLDVCKCGAALEDHAGWTHTATGWKGP